MPVIARANAEQLGTVSGVTVAEGDHRFRSLHIGGPKRHPRFVDWAAIASFGEDAVIVEDATVVREAADEREEALGRSRGGFLDQRVLTTIGDELGKVDNLDFDPGSGRIETIGVAERRLAGGQLRGVGAYAVVVEVSATDPASTEPSPPS
jgi:sporulation protein YlmC with PRC-barrel domain